MKAWLAHHLHSLKISVQGFQDAPLAALFTILVIGVAASLPTGLYLLLENFERAADSIRPQAEITVFIKPELDESQARALGASAAKIQGVTAVQFVHKRDGVKKLEAAGLSDIAAGLPENPLPHALILGLRDATPAGINAIGSKLKALAGVDRVLLDVEWIKRLHALIGLGRDMVWILAALLALALAAITANTIRLQIFAKRTEIEVASLIGATDRFIRRPFLYFGGLQGLAGGLAAWLLVLLGVRLVEGSIASVASAYGSSFHLSSLGPIELIVLFTLSASLGWLGAFIAVSHTLRKLKQQA